MSRPAPPEGMTPILDDLNLDLFITVLSHTLFSPFFIIFIPILNFARGAALDDSAILWPIYWFTAISVYQTFAFSSRVYRSGGTWLFKPARLDWGEQIVLITGGAGGVGQLLANTLAVRNVSVVVLDVKERLDSENYNIYYYKCDVSNAEEVETAATRVRKEVGDPTVIVNSAAIVAPGPLLSQSASSVARAFEVNTLSHFNILRTFLPYLVAQKSGHVVTISSILGQQGVAHLSAYCATKAALVSLHRSLRRELISHCRVPGVRTTLLVPGQIHTSLFASLQLRKNWLRDFVAPPLPAHTVVKEIIRSLDERESGEVYMPFYARCVEALDWLPLWVRDAVQAWTGADEGMAAAGGQTGSEQEKNVA